MDHSSLFSFFSTVDSKHVFHMKVYRWLSSSRGLLVSEATTLPTEPQTLPFTTSVDFNFFKFLFSFTIQWEIDEINHEKVLMVCLGFETRTTGDEGCKEWTNPLSYGGPQLSQVAFMGGKMFKYM